MKRKIDTFWYWFLVIVSFVVCYMFTCATKTKAAPFLGNVTYNEGQILVDTATGNTLELRKGTTYYYVICNTSTKTIIYHNCTWSDEEGLVCTKYIATKTNGQMETSSGSYTYTFWGAGGNGLVLNNVMYMIQNNNSGYTEEDLENARNEGYQEGFEDGQESVDITIDNLAYAEQYLRDKFAHEEIYDAETVSLLIQHYNQMLIDLESGWNAGLEQWNELLAFTEDEIFNIYDGTLNFVIEPEQKNQYYQELIIQHLELLISILQEEAYIQGQESVDITTDNESYANQVIQDKLDNNQLFDAEYVFNVIQNAEDKFYNDGFEDGKNSIDITSNDSQVIQEYITNNNYHTNTDYLNYGNQKYQEGQNSIDITSNDAQVIQDYITLNKMKTEEDYLYYGAEQRREGYFTSYDNFINAYDQVYSSNNYMTVIGYMCETYTSGAYSCSEAYKGYLNDLNTVAVNSVDITVNDEQIYNNGLIEGQRLGYQNANEDGEILGSFIPNLLGGIGSFFLTIMNIDILGFNLLTLFGILITILGVIVVLKFLKG